MTPPRKKRLRAARKLRSRIAADLHDLESGELNLRDVLTDPTDTLGRVSAYTLLTHTPKLGKAGAKKVLQKADVWPMDRVANLSEEKRMKILKCLPPRVANRYPQVH